MDSSLCRLNVEFARNSLCLIFDDLINSYYISAIMAVKNEKGEMSLKSSIWPSCLIPEITISHACRLKRPSGCMVAVSRKWLWKTPKIVFIRVFSFVQQKIWTVWLKGASTKNCESVKGKFVTKTFFQIILNKVLNPQCWHFCKWIK